LLEMIQIIKLSPKLQQMKLILPLSAQYAMTWDFISESLDVS
jgi:hypothetical protein